MLAQQKVMPIWVWSLILIGLLGAALLLLAWVRRRLRTIADTTPAEFTLSDLRRMKEAGQIDDDQYQKLREAVIGTAKQ